MASFFSNLILFSPLLGIGLLIFYLLDKAQTLRQGAGLAPPEPEPPLIAPIEDDQTEADEVEEEDISSDDGDYSEDEALHVDDDDAVNPTQEPDVAETGAVAAAVNHQNPPPLRDIRTRTVGAKKARSLARRDQRRAYYEFLHTQASERARAEAAIAEEEDERVFQEKRRRALIEDEINAKREKLRLERAESERKERESRRNDVEKLRIIVGNENGKKAWRIQELAKTVGRDEEWVEAVLKAEGLMGFKGDEMRFITGEKWYVIVGKREFGKLSSEMEKKGKMEWREMAEALENTILQNSRSY